MRMNDWVKILKGDMSGFKKEEVKEEIKPTKDRIYRLSWANGQRSQLLNHDEAVRRINESMNRVGWEFIRVKNTKTDKNQIVFEPKSKSNRGYLHLKKLNESMLEGMNWDHFYLKNGIIVDEDGHKIFNNAPKFKSVEDAEKWLEKNDERGNVVGDWKDKNRR